MGRLKGTVIASHYMMGGTEPAPFRLAQKLKHIMENDSSGGSATETHINYPSKR